MLSTLQPHTSSSFKMVNLVLEQDPKSVNINPAKQEVETEGELNRHSAVKQQRRMLLIVSEIRQLWGAPLEFHSLSRRLYVVLEQDTECRNS